MRKERADKKNTASRNEQMLNEPVNTLIPRLAVPTVISMLITSIYNMADTFFVSQLGTSASGAVGIIYSAMALIQAFSFMIGMGAGNNISRRLGAGDSEAAKKYASTAWFTGFAIGIVIAVLGIWQMKPLVRLLGATETIAPYAEDYARFIFLAAPFMMCSFIMNNLLRNQGLSFYAMIGITTGGILNMGLDPILIFGLGLGTTGAGIATASSQVISFFILLIICSRNKEAISISPRHFTPSRKIFGDIFYIGFPSLARQGIGSVSTVVLNNIAGAYGDAAIAALSIVSRFTMFINSAVIGFGQGFQPVCGFNYGAGKVGRVREAFWFSVRVTTIALVVLVAISLLFSGNIIAIFRRDDPLVISIGTFALRVQLCTLPIWGFYSMSNMLPQAMGLGGRATIISCARQGLFLIPVLFILPRFFGLRGLQFAQPVSDLLAFLLSAVLIRGILRDLRKKEETCAG